MVRQTYVREGVCCAQSDVRNMDELLSLWPSCGFLVGKDALRDKFLSGDCAVLPRPDCEGNRRSEYSILDIYIDSNIVRVFARYAMIFPLSRVGVRVFINPGSLALGSPLTVICRVRFLSLIHI